VSRILASCLASALLAACAETSLPHEPAAPITVVQGLTLQPVAVVNAFGCAVIRRGQVTRPAGSAISIALAWETKNRGLLVNYLQAQTTTISINGGPPVDASQAYSFSSQDSEDGFSSAMTTYATGITLAAGESMSFVLVITLSHQLLDGFTLEDEVTHRPLFFGPGVAFEFACTVTGA
jgi:hypothetical protein